MFSALSTPEKLKFKNAIGHFGTRAGKSPDRHVIAFKKESVFKMFSTFSNSSVWFQKRFRKGLVTVGLTVQVKLNFQISSSCVAQIFVKQTTQIKQITGAVPFLKNSRHENVNSKPSNQIISNATAH